MSSTTHYYRITGGDDVNASDPPFCYAFSTPLDAELSAYGWLWDNRERLLTDAWRVAQHVGLPAARARVRLAGPVRRVRAWAGPAIVAPVEVAFVDMVVRTEKRVIDYGVSVDVPVTDPVLGPWKPWHMGYGRSRSEQLACLSIALEVIRWAPGSEESNE